MLCSLAVISLGLRIGVGMKQLVFELLDVVALARPSLQRVDIAATAAAITAYKSGTGYKSYNSVFDHMKSITSGLSEPDRLAAAFAAEPDENWRNACQEAVRLLHAVFGAGETRWYQAGRKPIQVGEKLWLKPTIRGVWSGPRGTFATLINARTQPFLSPYALSFLSRGTTEMHVRDEPSIDGPLLVDFARKSKSDEREARVFFPDRVTPMALDLFELTLTRFMAAAAQAGYASVPKPGDAVVDIFRRDRAL